MTTGDLVNIHPTELKFPCKFSFFQILISNFRESILILVLGEVELKKQSSSSMQLTNKTTNKCVAFKVNFSSSSSYSEVDRSILISPKSNQIKQVKTTNPRKYCVRPNTGVVLPGDSCNVTGFIYFLLSSPFPHLRLYISVC